jgi:hypothetical protein
VAKEVMVGWARMIVSASVGVAVATQELFTILAALFLASAWFLAWSAAEVWIDLRFGVLLGYAPVRGYRRRLRVEAEIMDELSDLGGRGQQIGPRHSRARARERNRPVLPLLPLPRRQPDDSGPMEALADSAV